VHWIIATLLSATLAQADSVDTALSTFRQSLKGPKISTQSTSSGNATTETSGSTTPAVPSINPSASAGQASQGAGAGANQAAGQALMAAGSALASNPDTRAEGLALMAMGALALAQSAHDSNAADQSANTLAASNSTSLTPNSAGTAGFSAQAKQGLQTLADNGYSVSAAGVTNPDGSLTPASAYSSPSAMAAAGMSPAVVAEAKKVTDALNAEMAKVGSVGVSSEGGGGQGPAAASNSNGETLVLGKYKNPFALGIADKSKLVAGKTILFDGEPIGVSGGNIFDMVHAAYEKKRGMNTFIETEGPSLRAPASVPSGRK
jgi:hypothetical protein